MQKMQQLQEANIPPFLIKIWKIVSDPETDHVISWRECGNTFIIHNQGQFWYDLLPLYFKHNNMSSFVRQLNLYGFHKVSSLDNSSLSEKEDKSIQFHNPYFRRDAPELLKKIRRKPSSSKSNESRSVIESDELNDALKEISHLRGRKSNVDSQLSAMKQENSILWRELALLRQKHVKQQLIVNKLIQFLSTMVGPSTSQKIGTVERCMPLMLNESPAKRKKICRNIRSTNDGKPTTHKLDSVAEFPPEQLIEEAAMEDDTPLIDQSNSRFAQNAPGVETLSDASNVETSETTFWDKPDVVTIEDAIQLAGNEEEVKNNLQKNVGAEVSLHTNRNGDDHVSSAMSNINGSVGKNIANAQTSTADVQLKKNQTPKISNGGDLDLHLDSTESDELKDIILNGCSTLDNNTLFELFSGSK